MTANLPKWFTEAYDQTFVQHRAQQIGRRLAGTITNAGTFIGESVYFPRIGAVEAITAKRFQRLGLLNVAQDMIKLDAEPKFVPLGIWDPDKNKLSVSVANEYGKVAANAIARAQDQLVIDALAQAANLGVGNKDDVFEPITTLGDYNTVMDLDMVMQAIGILGGNEMWEAEQVTVVMPFLLKTNMAMDPYLAKSDVKGNRPWEELDWRSSEKLPKTADGNGADCFIYAKSALIEGANDQVTNIDEREGAALTDIIGKWFQAGAVAREPKGIIRIKTKTNFTVTRHPVPIIDVSV